MKQKEHESSKTKKKGISFNEFAEVYKVVPRRSMYSVEEKKAIWSEKADYDQFKKEIRQTVKQLEQGRRASDSFHTTLGVTHLIAEERKARANNRACAWDAVLNEQDVQQQLGRRDSILLADLYRGVSEGAGEAAILKAQRAAQEVADMYASHTMDDIEVMEPSHRLEKGTNNRRRSSSCNHVDYMNLLSELNLSASALNESALNVSALTEL